MIPEGTHSSKFGYGGLLTFWEPHVICCLSVILLPNAPGVSAESLFLYSCQDSNTLYLEVKEVFKDMSYPELFVNCVELCSYLGLVLLALNAPS